jgi:hypothetical protein
MPAPTTFQTMAVALYPTMPAAPDAPSASPTDTVRADALFLTMKPTDTIPPVTVADPPAKQTMEDSDAAPIATVPEGHYARAEDFAAWEAEVQAGPLAARLPEARAFLQQHAPPALITMLSESGYGSNPHVVQFVADLAAKFNAGAPR